MLHVYYIKLKPYNILCVKRSEVRLFAVLVENTSSFPLINVLVIYMLVTCHVTMHFGYQESGSSNERYLHVLVLF